MGRRLTGSRCSHGAPNTHSVSPNTDRSGAAHHPLPPVQARRPTQAEAQGTCRRALWVPSPGLERQGVSCRRPRSEHRRGRGAGRGVCGHPWARLGRAQRGVPPGWGGRVGPGASASRGWQPLQAAPSSRGRARVTTRHAVNDGAITEKSLRARRVRGASHALTHTTPQADAALGRSRWELKARPEGARQPAAKPGRGSRPRTAAARRLPRGFATRVRVAYVLGAQRTPA